MSKGLPLNVIYAGARCVKLMRISRLYPYEWILLRSLPEEVKREVVAKFAP